MLYFVLFIDSLFNDRVSSPGCGGFIIHGLQPGPKFFVEHPDIVISIFTTMLVGTIMMVIIQLGAIKFFARLLSVPNCYLCAGIMVIGMVGSFALRNSFFDVTCTIMIGGLAYLMKRSNFPIAPLMLALILGQMFEMELRMTYRMFGSLSPFVTRPIALIFLLITVAMIVKSTVGGIRDTRNSMRALREAEK